MWVVGYSQMPFIHAGSLLLVLVRSGCLLRGGSFYREESSQPPACKCMLPMLARETRAGPTAAFPGHQGAAGGASTLAFNHFHVALCLLATNWWRFPNRLCYFFPPWFCSFYHFGMQSFPPPVSFTRIWMEGKISPRWSSITSVSLFYYEVPRVARFKIPGLLGLPCLPSTSQPHT